MSKEGVTVSSKNQGSLVPDSTLEEQHSLRTAPCPVKQGDKHYQGYVVGNDTSCSS